MVERSDIHAMLDELRFDEVERLLAQDGQEPGPELREEIIRRRAKAEEQARALCRRLVDLGEARQIEEIVEMMHDPLTRPLIELTDDGLRDRADLYLREANRWEATRRETNTRRLDDARKALDGLDLEMARGLVNKVNGKFLSPEQNDERDQLLLDISARVMEMESLDIANEKLVRNDRDQRKGGSKRPWWRRRHE